MSRFAGKLGLLALTASCFGASSASAEIVQRDYRGRTYYYTATQGGCQTGCAPVGICAPRVSPCIPVCKPKCVNTICGVVR